MMVFLELLAFWIFAVYGSQHIWRLWRQWSLLQPARYLNEIANVDYYRQISKMQFESLVWQTIRARQYTLLGNPFLGRTNEQGYAWKKGKKTVLIHCPAKPLTQEMLDAIARKLSTVQADQAIVFSPFPKAPEISRAGVEVLYGKKLVKWFSVLEGVVPPINGKTQFQKCECGAPMRERISRAGVPLVVCSLYPDCRVARESTRSSKEPARVAGSPRAMATQ